MQRQIGIDGMHCASCSSNVEKALSALPGVKQAHVNLALEEAMVDYDERKIKPEVFEKTISSLGFSVRENLFIGDDEHILRMHQARRRMILAWVITALVIVFMLPHMVFKSTILGHKADAWVMFSLSLIAMLFPARGVYISAFKSLRSGNANMDVLIALGTIASMAVSPLSVIVKSISVHDFAGIAAMILAFHLTGRYLENRARGKASEAIRKLINLGAKTALILEDGIQKEIPIHKIKVGDVFIVKPGAKVPTDGSVAAGTSSLDESIATGESLPVTRTVGDPILGGTINLDGYLEATAVKVGNETFLAQVIRMVSEAQHAKVPIQMLADRITAIFVPVILVLALTVFLLWMLLPGVMGSIAAVISGIIPLRMPAEGIAAALMAAIATLVIACPCALGLATPTALMVGSGIGAMKGILIRSGEALQRMKDVDTIVFDKTGTLTIGKPELISILSLQGKDQDNLLIAHSLEALSEHPLANAINTAARAQDLVPQECEEFLSSAGQGVSAVINGSKYYLGSLEWLQSLDIDCAIPSLDPALAYSGKIYLADAARLLAVFFVADAIKPEAREIVSRIKSGGITPYMISGDNQETAAAIAALCGIEQVMARVMPQDKAQKIKELQASGRVVAMVGDGINDAIALKQADIGIAMGKGTDIAIEAADITLLRGDLQLIPLALKLSVETFRKIRQNLFWAFFYNLIAIPLAAFGILHPVVAEIAMAVSSLTVVTNANLLKRRV